MDHGVPRSKADLERIADEVTMEYLKQELNESVYTDEEGHVRQNWDRRRAAAVEVMKRAGLLEAMKNMSRGGALHLPPPWPMTDIVEVAGGKDFLDCLVRTLHPTLGKQEQGVRIALKPGSKPTQTQIGDAYQRGSWLLKKQLG